ncbi:MAG TPA: glycosyltransferase family 4 protein [Terriglobales bacterium]
MHIATSKIALKKNGQGKRLKIAQVAPLYESVPPKRYGGTERVVSVLTEELVRLGHDVTLFASGDSLTSARLIPVCPESLRTSRRCIDQLAHHIVMLEQVMQMKKNFDLVHFHVDYLHFPMSRREQVVSLSTLHGRLDLPDLVPIYQVFQEMPVVSISDAQREPLPWLNWQGTVHHGLPERNYSFYPKGSGYLAFLGRTSPEKGLDRAIEIATRAGIPLKIAAKVDKVDAEYFDSAIKPLLKNPLVEFLGEIGYPEKNDFLGNAAAVLFPVDWPEPFGLVMIESMACGTPVIAFNRGSVPEVMKDGVSGFVVSDVEGAVRAVQNLSSISRRNVRRYFEDHFSGARMAEDYLGIYHRLLERESEALPLANGVLSWMKLESPSNTT